MQATDYAAPRISPKIGATSKPSACSSNGDLTDSAKLAGIRREQPGLKNVKTRTGKDYLVFDGSGRDPESRVRFPLAL